MGFFSKEKTLDPSLNPRNPAALFSLVGLGMMWNEIAEAENKAVDTFNHYIAFKESLNKKYPRIDFNREIMVKDWFGDPLELPFKITSGIAMYLKAIEAHSGFLVTTQDSQEGIVRLDFDEYRSIVRGLTKDEAQFSDEYRGYVDNNIRIMVEDTAYEKFGTDASTSPVPVNTQELVNYHKLIASDMGMFDRSNIDIAEWELEEWENINMAPLFNFNYSSDKNPIIPISIEHLDPFVLDWICYATMASPTFDTRKLLSTRGSDNQLLKNTIINNYGESAYQLVKKTLKDMSCSAFRSFVRQGLRLEEAKKKEDVEKYVSQFVE